MFLVRDGNIIPAVDDVFYADKCRLPIPILRKRAEAEGRKWRIPRYIHINPLSGVIADLHEVVAMLPIGFIENLAQMIGQMQLDFHHFS
jgi:hypothetical protein